MFYFYFQNCSNTPLIRKSLKVEHTIEACGPFRILGNLGEIKYKGGISTKCPVSFLENQLNRHHLFIVLDLKKIRIKPDLSKLSNQPFSFSELHHAKNLLNLLFVHKM